MDFERVWAPFLYLYGVGGLFFLLGILLIMRSGACRLDRPSDRRWLRVLVFGFFWFVFLHGASTLVAVNFG